MQQLFVNVQKAFITRVENSTGLHPADTTRPSHVHDIIEEVLQSGCLPTALHKPQTPTEHAQKKLLLTMLPDLHAPNRKERLRLMANHLGEPQKSEGKNLSMPQLFENVQKAFITRVENSGGLPFLRDHDIIQEVLQLGRLPTRHSPAEQSEKNLQQRLFKHGLIERALAANNSR